MPDGRKLSAAQLAGARGEAVALLGEGLSVAEVARRLGLSRPTIYNALRLAGRSNPELQPASRGRKQGTGGALSAQQQREVLVALSGWPIKAGIKRRLWTRQLIVELVQARFQIAVSDRVIANYCVRWGLDLNSKSSSPLERASPAVRGWLDQNVGALKARVASESATLLWMNQHTRLPNEPWTGAGQAGRRYFVSVSNQQGRLQWMVCRGAFKAAQQIALLTRLVADQPLHRRLIVVRHDSSVLCSGEVGNWVAANSRDVEVVPPVEVRDEEEEKAVKAVSAGHRSPASPPFPAFDHGLDADDQASEDDSEAGSDPGFDQLLDFGDYDP